MRKNTSGVTSVILAGVGGQGTILVSKILTQGLLAAGYDVKMSEVHGMSQRGGSVSTQVRYGRLVHSPIIGLGGADILVAFEKLEAARYAKYLKPGGTVIVNMHEIFPVPVSSGLESYPQGIVEALESSFRVTRIDAAAIAAGAGNPRTMNIVLLGAMVKALGMEDMDWQAALRDQVPPKALAENLAAFAAGMGALA
jgi:indolepyruvate ferredoxin oxidoreductase beta subunit